MGKPSQTRPDHSFHLLNEVIGLILGGIDSAAGKEMETYIRDKKHGSVSIASHWASGSDFTSTAASDIFYKQGCIGKLSKGKFEFTPFKVTIVSELGLQRDYEYLHPRELAQNIIKCLDEVWRCSLVGNISVNESNGAINIVTKTHLNWHLVHDRIPCHICSHFLKGSRGLRCHQILVHGIEYEIAQSEACESQQWLIVYEPPLDALRIDDNHNVGFSSSRDNGWNLLNSERMVKEAKHALSNMDAGITAAKTGDLEALKRLVANRWDVHNTVDKNGSTAFFWAVGEGHLDICKYLYHECNIDVNEMKGKDGKCM